MKKLGWITVFCLMLAACAALQYSNTDWIVIGPEFPATKDPSQIEIFTNAEEITHPYAPIGLLRIKNLKADRDTLKRGLQQARKYVAEKGADAIFLAQYNNASDNNPRPTVTLIVYALKYGDNLTDEDKKAMQNFELDSALNTSITM